MIERSLEIESPESNLTSRHTGRSNDNGIDGLIIQDFPDGEVHNYYIQAKLYSAGNNISNGDLRNFIGLIHHKKLIIMLVYYHDKLYQACAGICQCNGFAQFDTHRSNESHRAYDAT